MLRDTFAVGQAGAYISILSTNFDVRIFVDNEINTEIRIYLFLFACKSRTASLANRLLRRFHVIIVLASSKSGVFLNSSPHSSASIDLHSGIEQLTSWSAWKYNS